MLFIIVTSLHYQKVEQKWYSWGTDKNAAATDAPYDKTL